MRLARLLCNQHYLSLKETDSNCIVLVDRLLEVLGGAAKMKTLLALVTVACLIHIASSQCTEGQFNDDVVGMLLADSMVADGQGSAPTVTVLDYNIVCLSMGTMFSNFRTASLVVEYNCAGAECPSGKLGCSFNRSTSIGYGPRSDESE